ncbi:hypothetical protein [Azospirillum lipoferum]|uniref:Elp3/MiaA/NifB-like radical SAM core domain-containing protein n=1 Tax=Azospirillum lipoferum (strain 4B) TaxID=862719 RepID=G7Z8J8_AZOL4|nr:hypothetical protein [Azospirillum lipoferum]CBS87287.1 protein of unknown function; putative SAM domain [Azospirillum lipoferum 4B]
MTSSPDSQPDVAALARRMVRLMRRFRQDHPLSAKHWPAGIYMLPIRLDGRPAAKTLVWYETEGCQWSIKSGCTMCNFGQAATRPSDDDVVRSFKEQIDRLDPGTRYLHLGPGGSFLDWHELNPDARRTIYGELHRLRFLEGVGIECRAELVTPEYIAEALAWLPSTVREFTTGIGLESADDLVRLVAVNKKVPRKRLERAFEIIRGSSDPTRRIVFDLYVLLKPPFLSEREAIDDAVRSIDWAFDRGADTVSVFLSSIKENTLCDFLHRQDGFVRPLRYATAYYHSAFEVLRMLAPSRAARTLFMGITSGIPAHGRPRSCPLCDHILSGALVAHNFSRDPALLDVAAAVRCDCRDKWLAELAEEHPPLSTRLPRDLDLVEKALTCAARPSSPD